MTTAINLEDYYPGWNDLSFSLTADPNMTFTGSTTIGDASTDTLTVAAAATFSTNVTYTFGDGEVITINATDASGGAVAPFVYTSNMDVAGATGGRALFTTVCNAAAGAWINAIRGYMNFDGTSGSTSGLASGICAELKTPNRTLPSGAYYPLEVEYVAGGTSVTSTGSGARVGFIYMQNTVDLAGDFDSNGYLFTAAGLTAGAGNILSAQSITLKVQTGIAGSENTRYLVMSSTENSLVLATTSGTSIEVGTCTTGLNFNGTLTTDISFSSGGTVKSSTNTLTFEEATLTMEAGTLFSVESADIRLGFDDGAYMKIAVTDATGVTAVTFAGSGVTYTLTSPTVTFVASSSMVATTGTFTIQPASDGNAVINLKSDAGAHLTITQTNGAGVTFLSTSDGTAGFLFDGGIVTLDGGATLDNTASGDILNITEATITLTASTKVNLDGATDVTGILTVDTTGSPADGIKINATTPTDGLEISSACGSHAINISAAQTGAGITIANTCGTYGLNVAEACTTAAIAVSGTQAKSIAVGTSGTPLTFSTDGDINAAIYSDYTKQDGYFRGFFSQTNYKPASDTGTASVYALMGYTTLAAGDTHTEASSERLVGVDGRFSNSGTLNGAGIWVAGTRGAIFGSGTWTEVKFVAGVAACIQLSASTAVSTGMYAAFYAYQTGSTYPADAVLAGEGYYECALDMNNWRVASKPLFKLKAQYGCTTSVPSAGGTDQYIDIDISGTAYRIKAETVA